LILSCVDEPMRAVRQAQRLVGEGGTVCVAGSLYLVGEVLSHRRA